MNLSEELTRLITPYVMFDIRIFGLKIPVSDTVVMTWLVMAIIIILALVLTRNMKQIPTGKQNIVEAGVDMLNKMVKEHLGHHWRSFAPYLGTVLIFLLTANVIGFLNVIPFKLIGDALGSKAIADFGIEPPARDINVPACLALMTVSILLFGGMKIKGVKGWAKGLVKPLPIMLPFNILEYAIKPLTLCLRLFGNVLGTFIVMELCYSLFQFLFPLVFGVFDLFDGLLQGYVFVFLTTLYIAEAIE